MNPPLRVVHTADLHLGSAFRSFPVLAGRLREEQLSHLARLVSFCAERQVHVLLIAGDLFDTPLPPARLAGTVAELFASIPDTAVFLAAGNHDPAFIDSPYRLQAWPANVHCFTDTFSSVDLPVLPVRVHGAGFTATAAPATLLPQAARPADRERLNLLVLHGDLVTPGQGSVYNPVTLEWLDRLGMDYTALGHRHDATDLLPAGAGFAAYSGCPLGRGFDETGIRSIRLIEFSQSGGSSARAAWSCRSSAVPLGGRIFLDTPVDVSGCATHEAIADRILEQLSAAAPADWADAIHRVRLQGEAEDTLAVSVGLIQQMLGHRCFAIEILDEMAHPLDIAALAVEASLRGTFVRLMAERIAAARASGQDREAGLASRALTRGLEAFAGEVQLHADP